MPVPTFNSFSLNDSNFITERVTFKGFASRAVTRANISRREGVKLLNTEFGEKEITIEGVIVGSSASNLQALVDGMKTSLTAEEADLSVEADRTYTATVKDLMIPDEHYNQSKAPFEITFICSNPFAVGSSSTTVSAITSGIYTYSGTASISGTFYNRPTITYTPAGAATGNTLISSLVIYHVPTGQSVTVSGFGSGTGLSYANPVTVNFDELIALEGSANADVSGAFPRWEIGTNQFTVTVTTRNGGGFPGGSVTVAYQPRYI